jgi:hypothetical protein
MKGGVRTISVLYTSLDRLIEVREIPNPIRSN